MLGDGQRNRDARRLQHGAAPEAHVGRPRLAPEHAHLATLNRKAAQEQGDRSGLPRAVRAEHRQHLARPNAEVDPVEREDVAVAMVHARELGDALAARLWSRRLGGRRHPEAVILRSMIRTGGVLPVVPGVSGGS